MRTVRRIVFIAIGGALAFVLSYAHPSTVTSATSKYPDETVCGRVPPGTEVFGFFGAEALKAFVSNAAKANLPRTVTGRSIGIDGQIWSKGDNFLEFHDSPSIDFSAALRNPQVSVMDGSAPKWKIAFDADVSGTARLKRMLAHVGAHNSIALKKDNVSIEAQLSLQPVEQAWVSVVLSVVNPPYIPVTATSRIWGIDVGYPFRLPVPAGPFSAQLNTTTKFSLLGVELQLSPLRASIGIGNTYCVFGRFAVSGRQ